MMDPEHLHLFINEEIYVLSDKSAPEKENDKNEDTKVKEEPVVVEVKEEEISKDHQEETPSIPDVQVDVQTHDKISLAIFHEATNPSEVELLQKIIEACNLEKSKYQVFANGFNKEVTFNKALVFVSKAKAFYEPIPYQESQILCSKPLSVLSNDPQEKAKLWGALQKFILTN